MFIRVRRQHHNKSNKKYKMAIFVASHQYIEKKLFWKTKIVTAVYLPDYCIQILKLVVVERKKSLIYDESFLNFLPDFILSKMASFFCLILTSQVVDLNLVIGSFENV